MQIEINKQQLTYKDILEHFNSGRSIVLFTRLNTFLFNSKVNKENEIINLLSTNEVIEGRILWKVF